MARFKVKFDNVEGGWVSAFFWLEAEEYPFEFSRVLYESAFARLCEALRALREEKCFDCDVTWMGEPLEYEMRFSKTEEIIRFEMWCFDGNERSIAHPPTLEFSIFGTYDEVCLPFWRAMRALQALYSEAEFKSRWRYEFPTRELQELTEALGK